MCFFRLLSLLIFFFPCFLWAQADAPSWQPEIQGLLANWKSVISVAYDTSGREISGTVVKRWTSGISDGQVVLVEDLPTTQRPVLKDVSDPKQGGRIEWIKSAIHCSASINLEPFVWGARSGANTVEVEELSSNRIIIEFLDRNFVVILIPGFEVPLAKQFRAGDHPYPGLSLTPDSDRKIGTAALRLMYNIETLPFPGPHYYLNHPIESEVRHVILSPSFPNRYVGALNETLKEWNTLIGKNYYLPAKKKEINAVDCLTKGLLCIQWTGGDSFSWGDYHGTTELAADPESGQVLGGLIYLYNDSPGVTSTPKEEFATAFGRRSSLAEVAADFSQVSNGFHFLIPDPTGLVITRRET